MPQACLLRGRSLAFVSAAHAAIMSSPLQYMFSSLRKLFSKEAPQITEDPIEDALRFGDRKQVIRLIIQSGVWVPYRDQSKQADGSLSVKFFDSSDCFPVFSSTQRIVPFLQQRGVIDGSKLATVPALQFGAAWFAANRQLCGTVVLNPGSETSMKFNSSDFDEFAKSG